MSNTKLSFPVHSRGVHSAPLLQPVAASGSLDSCIPLHTHPPLDQQVSPWLTRQGLGPMQPLQLAVPVNQWESACGWRSAILNQGCLAVALLICQSGQLGKLGRHRRVLGPLSLEAEVAVARLPPLFLEV